MPEKTVTSIELSDAKIEVELKSRREPSSPSGWAVIAFAPSCSLRSTRVHIDSKLRDFSAAIAASVGDFSDDAEDMIAASIRSITIDHDS
jgi:hypothetical protein